MAKNNAKNNGINEYILNLSLMQTSLKPQDSIGRFVKNFLDLQKVDHTIRKYH